MAAMAEAWIAMPLSYWPAPSWGIRTAPSTAAFCCDVAGQAADALARAGHFASLRGSEGWGHTAAAGGGGSLPGWRPPVGQLHVAAWI